MEVPEGFVLVQKVEFERMKLHCNGCDVFKSLRQDLPDGHAALIESPSNPKKRSASQSVAANSVKRTQYLSIEDTGSQPPSGTFRTGPAPSREIQPADLQAQPASVPVSEVESRKSQGIDELVKKIRKIKKEGWRKRQMKLGLTTVQDYKEVIGRFLSGINATERYLEEPEKLHGGLLSLGRRLASLTKLSFEHAALWTSVGRFQLLVLLSYCKLLKRKKISAEETDKLLQAALVPPKTKRERENLLRSIEGIHKLIVGLVRKGWTLHRATELFFLGALSTSDLARIPTNPSLDEIHNIFPAIEANFPDCLTPNYTVPGLIVSLFDRVDPAEKIADIEIYEALGYDSTHLASSAKDLYGVSAAKEVLLSIQVSTPLSFDPENAQPSQSIGSTTEETQYHTQLKTNPPARPRGRRIDEDSNELRSHTACSASFNEIPSQSPCLRRSTIISGPPLQLRVPNVVPDTALSIKFAMEGDISGLKWLFHERLASPWDVSHTRGYTLLRWTLYGGMDNYKTAQFLLQCGLEVDTESYRHVWDYTCRNKCSLTELVELRCISLNPPEAYQCVDWVEEQKFSTIHKIILGRSQESLRTELGKNPQAVHLKDAMGRTALDWATALAQVADMEVLIEYGSDLNTMDKSGRTTILHAIDSHNDDAVHMLLKSGANPNPKMPKDLYRSSPLTAASFGGLENMVKLLLDYGAEVNAYNPEGRTALSTVAGKQSIGCAHHLLNRGANPCHGMGKVQSPLVIAIMHNHHAVLQLFVERCEVGHIEQLKQLKLLPILANLADGQTMSIVTSSDLLQKTIVEENDFAASYKILRSRTDYNENLDITFKKNFLSPGPTRR